MANLPPTDPVAQLNDIPSPQSTPQPPPAPIELVGLVPPAVAPRVTDGPIIPDQRSPVRVGPDTVLDAPRERIAYILLGTLAAIIVLQAIASSVFAGDCWRYGGSCNVAGSSLGLITSTMTTIFTAMVGLVGSVVGFYFGSQKQGG